MNKKEKVKFLDAQNFCIFLLNENYRMNQLVTGKKKYWFKLYNSMISKEAEIYINIT